MVYRFKSAIDVICFNATTACPRKGDIVCVGIGYRFEIKANIRMRVVQLVELGREIVYVMHVK